MSVLAKILTQSTRHRHTYEPLRLDPIAFYGRFGIAIKNQGWQMVRCPFHDDRHASLSINGTHGGYICHACHAKGNMIGFYMRYHNTDFKGAMCELRDGIRGQV